MSLTDANVRTTKPGDEDQWLHDPRGVCLRVRTSGAATWALRRKESRRTEIITLGQYPPLPEGGSNTGKGSGLDLCLF
jgi:hypothetical protein